MMRAKPEKVASSSGGSHNGNPLRKFRLVFAVASTSREVVLSESQANFASAQSASHCYFLPAEMQHVSTQNLSNSGVASL